MRHRNGNTNLTTLVGRGRPNQRQIAGNLGVEVGNQALYLPKEMKRPKEE
jgi:hypothetical protein